MIEQETPKYKKKKESSVSKSKIKSKHKHDYSEMCLLKQQWKFNGNTLKDPWHYIIVSYCKICGKIYNYSYGESVLTKSGTYRQLSNEELLEKYKDLDILEIDTNVWMLKYIPIINESKENE